MLGIPVWAWIIVLLAAIGLSTLHYYRILRNRSSQIWWVPFALRAIGYAGVLLLLFNPWWQLQEEKVETPVLLVYEDRSVSVDSASLEKWRSMSTEIASMKKMRIQRFGFAHDVFSGDSVSNKDKFRSNLSAVMRHATAKSVTAPLGGMVIMTDGIINEGLDPLMGSLPPHTPIITVGAGNTAPRIDALVGGLLCNEEAFLGNSFAVEASIRAVKLAGESVIVRCLVGEEEVGRLIWSVASTSDWKRVNFDIKPKSVGLKRVSIVVTPLKGELNLVNNSQTKYVKVVDERKKVEILFAAPHPDVSSVARALGSEGQFTCVAKSKNDRSNNADVYVLHGWNWSDRSDLEWLSGQLNRGKAIWIFATPGMQWGGLGSIFGVNWGSVSSIWQDAQPQWNLGFSGWSPTSEESLRWGNMPPVKSPVVKLALPVGSSAVLWQKWGGATMQLPLMSTWKVGNAGVGMFFGEGLWRWRIEDRKDGEGKIFDAWVRRMTGLLAAGSSVKKSLEISISKQQFDLSEEVIVRVICRDKAGELDDAIPRTLRIGKVGELGRDELTQVSLEKDKGGWRGVVTGLGEGEYKLIAEGGIDRTTVEKQIAVVNQPMEMMNLQANHGLLTSLAMRSDGGFCKVGEVDAFRKLLNDKLNQVPVMRQELSNKHWWDSVFWFIVIVLCFGGEWGIRRWMGKY